MFSFLTECLAQQPTGLSEKQMEEVMQQELSKPVVLEEPADATWKMTVIKAGMKLGMDFDDKLYRHGVGQVVIKQVSEKGAVQKASRKAPVAAQPGDRVLSVNRFTDPRQMMRELEEQNHLVLELTRVSAGPLSPKTNKRRQAFLEYQRQEKDRRSSTSSKRSVSESDLDDVSTAATSQ